MNPRLTKPQLRELQPGDRVSRQLLGTQETAPVQRVTSTQVIVGWPDGSTARYWLESGTRTDCRGEVLREPDPIAETDDCPAEWSDGRSGLHTIHYATMPASSTQNDTAKSCEPVSPPSTIRQSVLIAYKSELFEALFGEMARHEILPAEANGLALDLCDKDSAAYALLNRSAAAGFDPRDTATLLVEDVIKRRSPVVKAAMRLRKFLLPPLPDFARW